MLWCLFSMYNSILCSRWSASNTCQKFLKKKRKKFLHKGKFIPKYKNFQPIFFHPFLFWSQILWSCMKWNNLISFHLKKSIQLLYFNIKHLFLLVGYGSLRGSRSMVGYGSFRWSRSLVGYGSSQYQLVFFTSKVIVKLLLNSKSSLSPKVRFSRCMKT